MSKTIAGIRVPDSQLATEATELLRASASPMLFNHSLRVYLLAPCTARFPAVAWIMSCSTWVPCFMTLG
jgi:hypothetical protein